MVEALFVSAGIGAVIAENASIAGASGGCQAEIGSASAMAAGGLAYLQGGDAECIANAAAFALKNMLGLTCDPVCGLVEVPCINGIPPAPSMRRSVRRWQWRESRVQSRQTRSSIPCVGSAMRFRLLYARRVKAVWQ